MYGLSITGFSPKTGYKLILNEYNIERSFHTYTQAAAELDKIIGLARNFKNVLSYTFDSNDTPSISELVSIIFRARLGKIDIAINFVEKTVTPRGGV